MPLPPPTTDEIVHLLRHTQMPTLLVEGRTDADIFRLVEGRAGLLGGTVLICGGRKTLLEVYDRRSEFSHLKAAFLADSDMWHFASVPQRYTGILFTAGYSLENDLLDGEAVERLLLLAERAEFNLLLDVLATWFAFEVNEWLQGRDPQLDLHINQILDPCAVALNPAWVSARGFTPPPPALVSQVRANYRLSLRGKQLIQVLLRILSAGARTSKYSRSNLIEIAATSPDHATFASLCRSINASLS